jgi:flagellar hook-length control protein FliK
MLNHESVVDRAGLRAIQAAATENPALASTPLSDASKASTAQASMTASLAAGLSAADPAAISQKPASSTPMSPPLITTDMKSGMTSGKNGLGKQQPDGEFEIADSSDDLTLRSSIMRDTAAVMMRESNITANLAEVSPRPASMATPGSMAAPAEISVLSSSAPAPLATAPTAPLADPSQPTARVAERWMHIDDLGKQFNTMVKRAFLDNSVNGLSSLRIMLYPENMGSIQAEIIDRNQTITVNLIVQSEEVARLLRDNSQSLRDALGNNNLMELNIQKDKSGNDGQMNRDGSETHGNTQARSNDAADNAVAQADTAGASSTSPNALDTYV